MDRFFVVDPFADGVKGLIFIGDKLLVYRRDTNTNIFPLYIDLPGGGVEKGETPFETFAREAKEEFDIALKPSDITYACHYPSITIQYNTILVPVAEYFPVAKLPADTLASIKLGNEGTGYMLMAFGEYLTRSGAIPIFQDRAKEYADSIA